MGATNFHTYAAGKTMEEAFNRAVADACYWHGHGGYTGTIAEKYNFVAVKLPPRWTSHKLDELLEHASCAKVRGSKLGKAQPLTEHFSPFELNELLERHGDKWGPALGVQLGPAEAKKVVAGSWSDVSTVPRGHKVFAFFGWASC